MSKFQVGDVVKFKSGSPAMTVIFVSHPPEGEKKCCGDDNPGDRIYVQWFDKHGLVQSGNFNEAFLVKKEGGQDAEG